MTNVERTLIIVKPDAVQRGLIASVLARFERRGLQFAGLKLMQIDRQLAEQHYGEHRGKGFFEGVVSYIISGPLVVAVLEGPHAIDVARATIGATNSAEAKPGTIRGDFAVEIGRNLIHGSDSPESAAREVALFFRPEELLGYRRAITPWVTEG